MKPISALLPAGLSDLLPPEAKLEADTAHALITIADTHGYRLVKPPLAEFEEGLIANTGQSLARQIFRFMDPVSQKMLAVRADITPQIARIASTRLAHAARPLRLAYSGDVLRVSGTTLRPERQFCQMGCELIGADDLAADAEIILLAASCLRGIGLDRISIDLNLPTLVPSLLADTPSNDSLVEAINRRDSATVRAYGGAVGGALEKLMQASGLAKNARAALSSIDLPAAVAPSLHRLLDVAARLESEAPDLTLTIDPLERRGFEYQTGVSFTIFCGEQGEIGRGGRYHTGNADSGSGEPAIGFTLFLDRILAALPPK